jgi:uncharacterized flavoprotein (TIGR03862 family)
MKKSLAIVGGGPAALLLAAFLDPEKFEVTIYEKNKSLARKFLVAGKGGFNLSHAESVTEFIERYTPTTFLKDALISFDAIDLRHWLTTIGIPTFIGSSNRIYPEEGIKPIEVLQAILKAINSKNVTIQFQEKWIGWSTTDALQFESGLEVKPDFTVFCMGGATWKKTGSDGSWLSIFAEKGVRTKPFEISNCAFEVPWSSVFLDKCEGSPLKNIRISCGDKSQKGEAVITRFGLEGNAIYGLSPEIRKQLNSVGTAKINIDLKPLLTLATIVSKLQKSTAKNTSASLKNDLNLSANQLDLLKSTVSKEVFLNIPLLAENIKCLKLEVISTAPLDEGISSVGGIELTELSSSFELKKSPNTFCIGEMLDWDAPTGGYLLQACFSMGVSLARCLNDQE